MASKFDESLVGGSINFAELARLVPDLSGDFSDYTPSNPDLEARTKFVPMSGIDVTSADDERPYIGTTSLASCAGIAIYDSENKIGAVAHVFFMEKESLTVYACDASGRAIPSTERKLVVKNTSPFTYLAKALIRKADQIGGNQYKFMAFNIERGVRTEAQNKQLMSVVNRTVDNLRQAGKILAVEYRNERDFRLDTRTGLILPYY